MPSVVGRNWCFTCPFSEDHPFSSLDLSYINFIVVGHEHGAPTEEKPDGYDHFQGYVSFKTNKRMLGVKTWLKRSFAHVEIAKGTPEQNVTYCTKENEHFRFMDDSLDDFVRFGELPGKNQGARTDINKFNEAVKKGTSELEMYRQFPAEMMRYRRHYVDYRRCLEVEERGKSSFYPMEVIYIWGVGGTGKSRLALERWPTAYRVPIAEGTKLWMDGYAGEETILLEDFESSLAYRTMLRILDVYPMQVEVKGGFVQRNWKRVVITSNLCIDLQYPEQHDRVPLNRRITETIHLELPVDVGTQLDGKEIPTQLFDDHAWAAAVGEWGGVY